MKLILIDGNEANVTQQVGVSVYTSNILHNFKHHASHDVRFCVYLRKTPHLHMPRENQYFRYRVVWGPAGWLKVFLPIAIYKDYLIQEVRRMLRISHVRMTAFFAPAHYSPTFLPKKIKLVVTIHDLAYLFYKDEYLKKDLYKLERWTAHSIHHARKVIAVSAHTKSDILKQFNLKDRDVEVVLNGFNYKKPIALPDTNLILLNNHHYKLEPYKYFLYLGTLQPRKNLKTLIYAFAIFLKERPDYKLVIAGKKGWMYKDIIEFATKLKCEQFIHFIGYIDEDEKNRLYAKAFAFVFPGFYEGFGIPILEAMANNCPVIASNAASIPEVAGRAALLFDPKNSIDLLEKFRQLDSNYKLRSELVEKGELQAKKFSWEKCGQETLAVLLNI